MKAQHNITQIADLLGRSKSTISRELSRNAAPGSAMGEAAGPCAA